MERGARPPSQARQLTRLLVRPAAAGDIEEGFRWYEAQRIGLGDEFLNELEHTIQVIPENPERFRELHRGTRRALLRRFPYGLSFRVYPDRILVVACMHASRDPVVRRRRNDG